MREILFRGKRISNGEWVEGFYFERKDTQGQIIEAIIIEDAYEQVTGGQRYIRSDLNHDCYRVDPVTVGQYTGLQDKNGRRIFEGDILKVTWGVTGRKPVVSYLFVEFAKGIFETKHIKDNKPYGMVSTYVSKEVGDCGVFCEVIGNIHDNPELMEVQNDG